MRRLLCVLLSAVFALSCCGCELQEDALQALTGDTAADLDALETPYVGMVLKSLDGQFYPLMKAGAEAEADKLGVELIVVAPEKEENAQEQEELLSIMADMALDALIIAPCDESLLTDSLTRAEQNGKILLAVDEELTYSGCQAYIGSDNLSGGQQEGTFAAQAARSDTAVILRGSDKSGNHTQRVRGLEQSLSDNGISVLACRNCNSSEADAYTAVQELMNTEPSIGVICTTNDSMAVGASRAVRDAGAEIPIVSFDGTPQVLELVQSGAIYGVMMQDAYQMGVDCIDTAFALYHGEPAEDVSVPLVLVTAENAPHYLEEITQKVKD